MSADPAFPQTTDSREQRLLIKHGELPTDVLVAYTASDSPGVQKEAQRQLRARSGG